MKSKRWKISFEIIDTPPGGGFGYADYHRKEAIEGIKELFSDFKVVNLKVKPNAPEVKP